MSRPGHDDRPPAWVGRATPPQPAPLPPASDPFWPPLDAQPDVYVGDGYPGGPYVGPYVDGHPGPTPLASSVAPRRRSGRTALLVVVGMLAACCAGGATLTLLGSAAVRGALSPGGSDRAGLNDAVRDGKFEFVVRSFSCGHDTVGRGLLVKHPQGQYCIAEITISNIGKDVQTFADSYQKAVAPDGTKYGADTGAGVFANENPSLIFSSVNPGNQLTGKIVYDIPKSAQIIRLELHDSPLSRGATVLVG